MLFLSLVLAVVQVSFFASAAPTKGTWKTVKSHFTDCTIGNPLLLTDGSVLIFETCGEKNGTLYTLSPDINGKYETGILKSNYAHLPNNWGPLFFSSSVLADGRVVIAGGEGNYAGDKYGSNKVGVYDPVKNKWTVVPTPSSFNNDGIADSQSVVLPDGSWLLGQGWSEKNAAKLDPFSLTWTDLKFKNKDLLGGGMNEEGFTLLPDGTVLTVACYVGAPYDGMNRTEIYNPATDTWTSAGSSPVNLRDNFGETGAAILRPDGTVVALGGQGNAAIYDTKTKAWRKAPRLPKSPLGFRCTIADGPAAILPNGNVLAACSGGEGNSAPDAPEFQDGPVFWYEFDGVSWFLQESSPFNDTMVFALHWLQLPTGQILQVSIYHHVIEVFTPGASSMVFQDAWRPVITSQLTSVSAGSKNNFIEGILFNGMTQGAAYGDENQSNSNYPLVRITNKATKHVFYCRTHDHSSMGVAMTNTPVSTYFDVPLNIELGPSTLEVIGAGIPSLPLSIDITAFNPNAPTPFPSRSPTRAPTLGAMEYGVFFCQPVVQFSGSQYFNYASIPETLSSSLTISMWITTTSTSAYLMSLGRSATNYENQFLFTINSKGQINFEDYCGGDGFAQKGSTVKVNTGVKTHVAFVKSGKTGTYYVNGVAAGTTTSSLNCQYKETDLAFGADTMDSNMYFSGSMSGVVLFSSSLSSAQIASIYNGAQVNPVGNALFCPQQTISTSPSKVPTASPTFSTLVPSKKPSSLSTSVPSKAASKVPTKKPTVKPTVKPTLSPVLVDFGSQVFYCKPVVQFNGAQYTNYPSIPQVVSSSLTISMWITSQSVSAYLITLGRSADNYENEFLFGIDADGYLSFLDYCGGYGFNGASTVKVNTGVKTHVAFVKSGTSGTFYVNGAAAGTLTASQSCQYEQTDLVVGADMRDSNMYFSGSMSGVAVFPSVLTPTQISSIYNGAPVNPNGNPLLCAI